MTVEGGETSRAEWTPVSESMPEEGEYVLVTCVTKKGRRSVMRSYWTGSYWAGTMAETVAWMPMPEPYGSDR